jgi:hypothetical protein
VWEAVEGFIKVEVEVSRTITLIATRQNGVGNADFIEGPVEQQRRGAQRLEGGVLIFGWEASRNGLMQLHFSTPDFSRVAWGIMSSATLYCY